MRDRLQVFDRGSKRLKDVRVLIIVIDVHDYIGDARDQLSQNLALHRREIKEAVEHQQLNFIEPRQRRLVPGDFAADDLRREQLNRLLKILVGQLSAQEKA